MKEGRKYLLKMIQQKEEVGSMNYFKDNDTQGRFDKLGPRQQHIILNLLNKIKVCRSCFGILQSNWCSKCVQTHIRATELFMRFEEMNHLAKSFGYNNNGFSDPTSTGEF